MSRVMSTGCLEQSFSSNTPLFQRRQASGKDVRTEWIRTDERSSIWEVHNCVFGQQGSNGLSDMTLWACNVLLGLGNVGAYRANMVDEARLNSCISAGFAKHVFWHQTLEASLYVMCRCLRCFRTPKDNFMWHHRTAPEALICSQE